MFRLFQSKLFKNISALVFVLFVFMMSNNSANLAHALYHYLFIHTKNISSCNCNSIIITSLFWCYRLFSCILICIFGASNKELSFPVFTGKAAKMLSYCTLIYTGYGVISKVFQIIIFDRCHLFDAIPLFLMSIILNTISISYFIYENKTNTYIKKCVEGGAANVAAN